MAAKKNRTDHSKKFFTVAEANAALPLVRAIVRDIAELAQAMRERGERLQRIMPRQPGTLGGPYQEELAVIQAELERDQERMSDYCKELGRLGIELKDPFAGLVDFLARMDDHEVYLCWRLGEPEVGHWHELEAGFAGRQKLNIKPGLQSQESGV